MNASERLIVLNSTKLGENSLVLHCLCREMGRRSFIVTVHKGGSRAMFLPLNILDAEVIENRKSDLWRLRGLSPVHPLNGIRSNFDKNAISLFMSEVLWRAVQDGAAEGVLYDWCERSMLLVFHHPSKGWLRLRKTICAKSPTCCLPDFRNSWFIR